MLPFKLIISNNKTKKRSLLLKVASYSFLLFFFFSFFVQQALVLAFTKEVSCIGYRCSSHQFCKAFAKSENIEPATFNAVEADLDEDSSALSEKFNEVKTLHETSDEIQYWSLLRTKYLQLLSNIDQQPFKPLFVLQHSWKFSLT